MQKIIGIRIRIYRNFPWCIITSNLHNKQGCKKEDTQLCNKSFLVIFNDSDLRHQKSFITSFFLKHLDDLHKKRRMYCRHVPTIINNFTLGHDKLQASGLFPVSRVSIS